MCRALIIQKALAALRALRLTDRSAKCDKLRIYYDPVVLRQNLHQIKLNLLRILLGRKPKPARKPPYMSIYNNRRIIKDVTSDKVRSLSSDSRQSQQVIQVPRQLSAIYV